MNFKIIISPEARNNLTNALKYYNENASLKVARNFVNDYKRVLNVLKHNPYFRVYYKDFRGVPLKKYPFIVFYQINTDRRLILIQAVFHTAQNTQKYP